MLHPMLTACIEVPILGDRISRAATPHMQITLNREPHSVGSTQVSTHSHKNLIVCLPMWQKHKTFVRQATSSSANILLRG